MRILSDLTFCDKLSYKGDAAYFMRLPMVKIITFLNLHAFKSQIIHNGRKIYGDKDRYIRNLNNNA